MKRPFRFLLAAFSACSLLAACGSENAVSDKPLDHKDERRESRGSLTGEGGFNLFGSSSAEEEAAKGSPIGVNSYLWRATLDTLSFMPLVSADPFGGTIITDWYEDPKTQGERYKVNALILDKTLRSDGVRVSVFKQKFDKGSKNVPGQWRDLSSDDRLSRKLEDAILTRARQLKIGAAR